MPNEGRNHAEHSAAVPLRQARLVRYHAPGLRHTRPHDIRLRADVHKGRQRQNRHRGQKLHSAAGRPVLLQTPPGSQHNHTRGQAPDPAPHTFRSGVQPRPGKGARVAYKSRPYERKRQGVLSAGHLRILLRGLPLPHTSAVAAVPGAAHIRRDTRVLKPRRLSGDTPAVAVSAPVAAGALRGRPDPPRKRRQAQKREPAPGQGLHRAQPGPQGDPRGPVQRGALQLVLFNKNIQGGIRHVAAAVPYDAAHGKGEGPHTLYQHAHKRDLRAAGLQHPAGL